jgi:hypothetical protein
VEYVVGAHICCLVSGLVFRCERSLILTLVWLVVRCVCRARARRVLISYSYRSYRT